MPALPIDATGGVGVAKAAPGALYGTLAAVVSWSVSIVMIWSGVIPYFPQYNMIKSSKNSEGFRYKSEERFAHAPHSGGEKYFRLLVRAGSH